MPIPKHITLLKAWRELSTDKSDFLDSELRRELPPGHVLAGLEFHAVAQTGASDEVLFELLSHEYVLAHVHLTWSKQREKDPRWPRTKLFASWDEWLREKMIPDNDDYNLS